MITNVLCFSVLAKQKELNATVAEQLETVLPGCDIVLLCDDSDSMQQAIAEEGNFQYVDTCSEILVHQSIDNQQPEWLWHCGPAQLSSVSCSDCFPELS